MIVHSGDLSNLILDNELDSYYLVDISLITLPRTQQLLGDISLQVGDWQRRGEAGVTTGLEVLAVGVDGGGHDSKSDFGVEKGGEMSPIAGDDGVDQFVGLAEAFFFVGFDEEADEHQQDGGEDEGGAAVAEAGYLAAVAGDEKGDADDDDRRGEPPGLVEEEIDHGAAGEFL